MEVKALRNNGTEVNNHRQSHHPGSLEPELMICLCSRALVRHLAALFGSNNRDRKMPRHPNQEQCLIFTAGARTILYIYRPGAALQLVVLQCISLQSAVMAVIRTGTLSAAPTSNTLLNIESSSAVATSIANVAFIEILYCKIHLNLYAQYSNLDSEQYISSVMGPELMINFCPRDYPGIYAVKNSKFEHFNGRIFIKIVKAILVYLLQRVCIVIAAASQDVTRAQRCWMQMKLCDALSTVMHPSQNLNC